MSEWTTRFSLEGRTALITGASKGIGFEICRVFADAGANIVASARDSSGLADVQRDIQAMGRECQVLPCELNDPESIAQMTEAALAANPVIDILVNNAGIATVAPVLDFLSADWDQVMAVNLRAPFLLAKALAPTMIKQRWGKIVNISSQAGVVAIDDHAAYSASKAGLNGLTRALMVEWARFNIQVNSICPTVIMTPMGKTVWGPKEKSAPMIARTPLGRFGEPIEVADLALFLASDASALINGESLMIDGGYSAV